MPEFVELRNRSFQCVIGSNAEHEMHRSGYNGVWSLVPEGARHSLFVPGVAGLNLEHYFDGWQNGRREVFFEPRVAPMTLEWVGETAVRLRQAPTPFWGVESVTTFTVREPDVIDLDFRCTPRKAVFRNGIMGVFWASYIHGPSENPIHFRGRAGAHAGAHSGAHAGALQGSGGGSGGGAERWIAFASPRHGEASSVRSERDEVTLEISEAQRDKLFSTVAPVRYTRPLFYGRWSDYAYTLAFKTRHLLRFAMSPSGGGHGNPAWDFQILVPEVQVGREARLTCRAWVNRWTNQEAVERQAMAWLRD